MNNNRIIKVKLSYPFNWPLMRQTPNWSGKWGNYEFILNDAITECDFWVIFSSYLLKDETCYCPPGNIIFMPGEAFSVEQFSERFLKQFALIITCQREIKHKKVSYNLGGHPWFIGKSYDELKAMEPIRKTKKLSIVTSNKTTTEGHRKRLDFAYRLKDHFKDDLDLFGRGITDFNDKWDVLAPYQYSIAIENDNCDDWLTEKFFDCLLSYTYPFYYGCPNAEKYFDPQSFKRIDINDTDSAIRIIEDVLNNADHYTSHLDLLSSERIKCLDQYNLFPLLVAAMDKLDPHATKKKNHISPSLSFFQTLKKFIK